MLFDWFFCKISDLFDGFKLVENLLFEYVDCGCVNCVVLVEWSGLVTAE